MRKFLCLAILLASLACSRLLGYRASPSDLSDATVTVTVFDHRHSPPSTLSKEEVVVRQDDNVRPVLAWQRLAGSSVGIDFAILIDDSLESNVAVQWREVAAFLRMLPDNTRVAVAYATHSGATIAQPFTSGRELAIKSLRVPIGTINEGSSVYLSLVDLDRRWPASDRRRMVLLISDGVDLFRGVAQSEPGLNRDLQQAIDESQKGGVLVDAIFAGGASHFSHNLYLIDNGQRSLARLALETGGTAYTEALETPGSFSPYLNQIAEGFANLYLLTFRPEPPAKPGFVRIQLRAEPQGIELLGPSRVYLPAEH
jgi:hypothetical protein